METIGAVAALGAVWVAALTLFLVATRHLNVDLVPHSAQARVQWWQRHAPAVLRSSIGLTVGCALAVLLCALAGTG